MSSEEFGAALCPIEMDHSTLWLCISDQLGPKCQLFAFNYHILPATTSSLALIPVSYCLDSSTAKSRSWNNRIIDSQNGSGWKEP